MLVNQKDGSNYGLFLRFPAHLSGTSRGSRILSVYIFQTI